MDAFEAARNILSAINSGELISLGGGDDDKARSTVSSLPGSTSRPPDVLQLHPLPTIPPSRVQLQTHLALLAAQLLEYATEGGRDESYTTDSPPTPHHAEPAYPTITGGDCTPGMEDEGDEDELDEDDDMELVMT